MPNPTPKTTKFLGPHADRRAMMSFLQAMAMVNHGDAVTRESWDNPELHVKMNKGQMCVKMQDGVYHPMIVSQEDFDGEDWLVVNMPGVPKIPQAVSAELTPTAKAIGEVLTPKADDPRDAPGKDE